MISPVVEIHKKFARCDGPWRYMEMNRDGDSFFIRHENDVTGAEITVSHIGDEMYTVEYSPASRDSRLNVMPPWNLETALKSVDKFATGEEDEV